MATKVVAGIAVPLIGELAAQLGQAFVDSLSASSFVIQQPHPGAVWISCSDGSWGSWSGQVVSCYFHPSKQHTATTVGRNGEKKSVAEAGHWAISAQSRARMGNKTFYNTL